MRNLTILLLILVFTSCGSKKKVTQINKGYDLSIEAQKKTVDEQSHVKAVDNTTKNTKVSESEDERVIERYIFSDEGRLKEYIKETNRKKDKKTDTDEKTHSSVDSVGQKKELSVSDIKKESKKETKNIDKERKSQNTIFFWVGGALFILILAFGAKYLLKR